MEAIMPAPSSTPSSPASDPEPGRGCLPALVRLIWLFGVIALIFFGLFIAQNERGLVADLGLALLTLLLIAARYVDIRFLAGETMDNKPATMRHWRRYAALMVVVAAGLFILAKIVAHNKWF
jgi:hypothetical protein